MSNKSSITTSWLSKDEAKQHLYEKIIPQRVAYLMQKVNDQEEVIKSILKKLDRQQKQKVAKGDIITFGNAQWQVLQVEGDKALIITEDVVEVYNPYDEFVPTTWETSRMREYLNNEFYSKFTKEDKEKIATTIIVTPDNPWYSLGKGGNVTQDKIFLLSIEEVVEYFGDSGQLINRPKSNDYGEQYDLLRSIKREIKNGWNYDLDITISALIDDEYNDIRAARDNEGYSEHWRLRSAGFKPGFAATVLAGGILDVSGYYPIYCGYSFSGGGVRPALWLNL